MFYVNANGASIPAIGFGTYLIKGGDATRMVRATLEMGYRHIDTAQIYGNEAEVGEGLATSGIARKDIFLTTKVWVKNFKTANFATSVEESLKKLGTDYIDLLLLHWPSPVVPLADQIGALNAVKMAGKVRHVGVSNYTSTLLAEASALSDAPLVTNQIEYHPYLDQSKVIAAAQKLGMCVTAYFAMAEGNVLHEPLIQDIAAKHGKSPAQIGLRWIIQQENLMVLSKTMSEERAKQNFDIFDFELTADEMNALHGLAKPDGRLLSPTGLAPEWD